MGGSKGGVRAGVLVWMLLLGMGAAQEDTGPVTRVPFTYEINYSREQAKNERFKGRFEHSVPVLYHAGADLRYLGRYGFGSTVYGSRKVAYPQYVEETRAYLDFLHGKGVRWVIPYLCNQTISGNDATRYGAWEVYDRWEEFQALGLGPKPPELLTWMQREPSGTLHYNYKRMCFLERGQSEENIRYAPCPNNPDWRRWCAMEARLAAELGFDGLFVDNCIIRCYCRHCEERFQRYLRGRYDPGELKKAFGTAAYEEVTLFAAGDAIQWAQSFPDFVAWLESKYTPEQRRIHFDTMGPLDLEHVSNAGSGMLTGEAFGFLAGRFLRPGTRATMGAVQLANPALQTPIGRLRWAETTRFWADSIGDMLAEMRDAGRDANPAFFVLPNWGTMQRVNGAAGRAQEGKNLRLLKQGADFQMFEEAYATGLIAPGVVLDYDVELRFAFAHGVRAALLPYTLSGEDITRVALAETAASGGGVFVMHHIYTDVLNAFQQFFQEYADLYDGYRSAARVALAHFFDQVHFLNFEHLRCVHALNRYLADQQIPFDHLVEDDLTPERLGRYRVLIFPHVTFLSDEEIDVIQGALRNGATIILVGPFATYDQYCRPRSVSPRLDDTRSFGRVVAFTSLSEALPHSGILLEPTIPLDSEDSPGFVTVFGQAVNKYEYLRTLDERLWFQRYQEPGPITAVISEALGGDPHLADPWEASGMRTAVYRKQDAQSARFVIHLANKNVPLAAPEPERTLRPVKSLRVRLPFSRGSRITSVTFFEPGKKSQPLTLREEEGGLPEVRLDHVDAYAVVLVECDR